MASNETTASFGIEIADDTAGGVASSTHNLEQLRAKLDADTVALGQMQKAMRALQGGSSVNVEVFKKLKQQIADQKVAVAAGTTKLVQLGGAFGKTKTEGDTFKAHLDQIKSSLLAANGPVGSMSSQVAGLITKLGKAGLVGVFVLAAAAAIAVAAAVGIATSKLAKFGLVQTDNYRAEMLSLAAMTKIPDIWGRAAGKWQDLAAITATSSQAWGLARSKVAEFTQSLYLAGYRGNALKNAVESTSIAVAAFDGDVGKANRYLGAMSWQFGMLGKGTTAFAARVKKDLGDIATRQSLGFGKQMAMLRQNVGLLFSTLKIEGFLRGLNTVLSLFSETTVSGKLMREIIGSIFDPLFGDAESAGIAVKHLVQDMIFWVLKAQGYWIDLQIWVAKTFGYRGDLGTLVAMTGLKVALAAAAGVALVLSVAMIGITASMVTLVAAVGLVVMALYGAGKAVFWLVKQFASITSIDWGYFGKHIVSGIADGITGAAGILWKAIKGLGTGAVDLLKSVLGIHSPSLVFMTQAKFIPAGMAAGIRQGAPQVRAATREMIAIPPPQAFAGAMPAMRAAPAAPAQITNSITIQVDGSKSPVDTAEAIKRVLEQILQGALTQAGAA